MLQRRAFLVALSAGLLVAPPATVAQEARKSPLIGYLGLNKDPEGTSQASPSMVEASSKHLLDAFRQGLQDAGWVEGQNIRVEFRYADGVAERLPGLVAELIRLKVDVIVTTNSATTRAAKDATKTIPIVMATSADAVGEGLVTSLAHPAGNITGMTALIGSEIAGKQLELLRELTPTASRVAALKNTTNVSHSALTGVFQTAALAFGVQSLIVEAGSPEHLDDAFATMRKQRAAALVVLTDAMFFGQRGRIVELAARSGLPAMYYQREFVDAGGLISYGPDLLDMFRRAATYVDKILKGAKPAELPVQQPTKFELFINLKTAKEFGLSIPASLLQRADKMIE
jgi:putative tryptophan/tyrosine transport system substrate-binding protein